MSDEMLTNKIRDAINNLSKTTLTNKILVKKYDISTGVLNSIAFAFMGIILIISGIIYTRVAQVKLCDSLDSFVPLLLAAMVGALCIIFGSFESKRIQDAKTDFESGNFIIYEKTITDKKIAKGASTGRRRFLVFCGEETLNVGMDMYYNATIGAEYYIIVRCTKKRNIDTQIYSKKEYKIPQEWLSKIQKD